MAHPSGFYSRRIEMGIRDRVFCQPVFSPISASFVAALVLKEERIAQHFSPVVAMIKSRKRMSCSAPET
jgi:hypothetical protein